MTRRFRALAGALAAAVLACDLCAAAGPAASAAPAGGIYARVLAGYAELQRAETEVFDGLVFDLSPVRLKMSLDYKLVVRDQLGRDWLFKAAPSGAEDGPVAVYRWFEMFGLDTPEIHYKTLNVNGRPVSGTLQRFIANNGRLKPEMFLDLRPGPAEYLAKNHVMSWLLANHGLHGKQFLTLGEPGRPPERLLRVDNSIEWYLMGTDRFDTEYRTPMLNSFRGADFRAPFGYADFWRNCLEGKFDVPLEKVYAWALFISAFPDAAYLEFFREGAASDFRMYGNNGVPPAEIAKHRGLRFDPKLVLPELLRRKREIPARLKDLYTGLAAVKKTGFDAPSEAAAAAAGEEILAGMRGRAAEYRRDLARLRRAKAPPAAPLAPQSSFEGYKVLASLVYGLAFGVNIDETGQLAEPKAAIARAREALLDLERKASLPGEKEALRNAAAKAGCLLGLAEAGANLRAPARIEELIQLNEYFYEQPPALGVCIGVPAAGGS